MQFIGGFTAKQAIQKSSKEFLKHKWSPIFDYAREGCQTAQEVNNYAQNLKKLFQLFKENETISDLHASLALKTSSFVPRDESIRLSESIDKMLTVIDLARETGIKSIMFDAEEHNLKKQEDVVFKVVSNASSKYDDIIMYKTIQMYRRNSLGELDSFLRKNNSPFIGVKLVRGAYLTQDKDVCFEDKSRTDANFNEGLRILLSVPNVSAVIATHNRESVNLATNMIKASRHGGSHVHFAQLLGMANELGVTLVADGFSVYKYVPYGNAIEMGPYLIRRFIENYYTFQSIGTFMPGDK